MPDYRQYSPAADRNRQPIIDTLQRMLPASGRALEIASGTGQHAAWLAAAMPRWTWQPTDAAAAALPSIDAWSAELGARNMLPALELDVMSTPWHLSGQYDAIFSANMLHIAPWPACGALMRGAAQWLSQHGKLFTYGPYLEDGVTTAPSNLAFDASLRERYPAWGIRRIEDVVGEAQTAGMRLAQRIEMPANNLLLLFTR